jgi:hypothetical protein
MIEPFGRALPMARTVPLSIMRRSLQRHRWVTLLVVGLLLFATSGLMLSRMTCLMSGRSVVAFGMLEDCCPDPEQNQDASVAPVCCVFGHASAEVEPFIPAVVTDQLVVPVCSVAPVIEAPQATAEIGVHASLRDRSPPLPPKARLALHATFRI